MVNGVSEYLSNVSVAFSFAILFGIFVSNFDAILLAAHSYPVKKLNFYNMLLVANFNPVKKLKKCTFRNLCAKLVQKKIKKSPLDKYFVR